jgi:D-alanyl-D-alanine carboxypeptidase
MHARLTPVFLLWLVASGLHAQPNQQIAALRDRQLENCLIRLVEQGGAPGAALRIQASGGQEWGRAVGYADVLTERTLETSDLFRIGDLTTIFTAVAVLSYVQDGYWSLEDPLHRYVPDELIDSLPHHRTVTLGHALFHTSGFADYLEDPALWERWSLNPSRRWTARELLTPAFQNRQKVVPPLGVGVSVSATNYVLLGLALGKLEGSWAKAIRKRICEPLNLKDTRVETLDTIPWHRLTHGYADADSNGLHEDYHLQNQFAGWGDNGILTSIDDLTRFMRAVFIEKRILKDRYLDMLLTGKPTDDGYKQAGPCIIRATDFGLMVGLSGQLLGYTTASFCFPFSGVCLSMAANGSGSGLDEAFDYTLGCVLEEVFR